MTRYRHSLTVATIAIVASSSLGVASMATAAEVATYPLDFEPGLTIAAPFPDYVLDVDCSEWVYDGSEDGYQSVDVVWVPGGSMQVNFTCESVDVLSSPIDAGLNVSEFPSGYTSLGSLGDFDERFTVNPNTQFIFTFGGASFGERFVINYSATVQIDNPTGVRIDTESVSIPEGGTQVVDFGDGADLDCSPSGERVYGLINFTVVESGEFTFRIVGVTPLQSGEFLSDGDEAYWWTYDPNPWGEYVPISDPYLVLYSDFDVDNPNLNQVACNDDIEYVIDANEAEARDQSDNFINDVYSELIADLEPGNYTLMLTTYDEVDAVIPVLAPAKSESSLPTSGEVSLSPAVYPLSALPEQSATLEFWGVAGGLVLEGTALAETGSHELVRDSLAGAALMSLLAGTLAIGYTRRRAARA
ncbi:hypothetical protein [Microcella sp.]|uniref:hypothetical protein n=1 Tax=Microcella sp. TaxID=1913979 RepID=UPI00299F72D4|nr:hypothetical protein [Microcella sp.]MDX2024978.1 hypothetical protein [Microcella sp.]